jgi:hypothetical protein
MFDPLDKLYDIVIIDVLSSTFINAYFRVLILQSIYLPRNIYSYNNTPILYDIKHVIDKSYLIV